jgi:quinol monooxygenase YgiN
MIFVYGKLEIYRGKRELFLSGSRAAILAARENEDCFDFSVSADLIEENRVNVFEVWRTRKALHEFRGSGPSEDLSALIESAHIEEQVV